MTYFIGSARHDENGRYRGGKKGDQTGQEVCTQKYYEYPSKGGWICWRFKNPYNGSAMKDAMLRFCADNRIGYSMSDRYSLLNMLKKNGNEVTGNCNTDCSMLIRACILWVTGEDIGDFTTASEGTALKKSGMFVEVGKVNGRSDLYEGDILVTAKKGHTVVVTTGISRQAEVSELPKTRIALARYKGQKYASLFCKNAEGSRNGICTRVLQHALNLDYGAGLKEDGIYGKKTETALGSHYVKYGEKQYLVSAAEIICYISGSDPKGYECPGIYGKGLKSATGKSKLTAEWFERMVQ